jgi:hypothetical protein
MKHYGLVEQFLTIPHGNGLSFVFAVEAMKRGLSGFRMH